jgi:hypothetical protein
MVATTNLRRNRPQLPPGQAYGSRGQFNGIQSIRVPLHGATNVIYSIMPQDIRKDLDVRGLFAANRAGHMLSRP